MYFLWQDDPEDSEGIAKTPKAEGEADKTQKRQAEGDAASSPCQIQGQT